MATGEKDPETIIREFLASWPRRNVDRFLQYFTDDAVYHNIPLAAAKGKAAIRKTIDGFMPGTTKIEFKILSTASAGATVFNERVDSFIVNGRPVVVPVAGVFEISGGKIKAWRDYFDLATYMNQIKGK